MQFQSASSRYYTHHTTGDTAFVRRLENGLHMPLSQSYSLDPYESSGSMSRKTTPSTEADRNGSGPRKRVTVACERCRKRKIKCSGDEDGPCTNCRNAGQPGACQFLRVASFNEPSVMMRLAAGRAAPWQTPHRFTPYPSPYRSHPSNTHSSYTYGGQGYSTPPVHSNTDYGYGLASQTHNWPRSAAYTSSYPLYDGQSPSAYSSDGRPAFLLPDSDPMTSSAYSAYPYMRNASALAPDLGLPATTSQPVTQLQSTSYSCSAYDSLPSYSSMSAMQTGTIRSDPVTSYANMNSRQSSVVLDGRKLPIPGRHLSAGQFAALDNFPMSASSHRSSLGWTTDTSPSSTNTSCQTSCSSAGGYVDSVADRSTAERNSHDLGLDCLGTAADLARLSTSTQATTASYATAITDPGLPLQSDLDQQARCRTLSRDGIPEEPTSSPSYAYPPNSMLQQGQERSVAEHYLSRTRYPSLSNNIGRRDIPTEDCGPDCQSCPSSTARHSVSSLNNVPTY